MASHADIVKDILNGGRVINREKKMDKTLDVMCDNLERAHLMKLNKRREVDDSKGYGQGRNSGD